MNNSIDVKEIERIAYLTYHKDGIVDIYIGLTIVLLALTDMIWMLALFPIFYRDSKRRYTFPRLGYVKFSEKTNKIAGAQKPLTTLIVLTFIVTLFAWYLGTTGNIAWIQPIVQNWKWMFAGVSAIIFCAFAWLTDLKRLYYYGALSLLWFSAANYLPLQNHILFLVFGGVVSLTGALQLYRFTREYPVEPRAENE